MPLSKKRFYWKGKMVNKKKYNMMIGRVQRASISKGADGKFASVNRNIREENEEAVSPSASSSISEGRRIIHLKTLAEQLWCHNCKSMLSLTDMKNETRKGLASIFLVQCRSCKNLTEVVTDKQHEVSQAYHFDCNTKVVIGTINGGLGHGQVNKVLTSLDIPELTWNTYRRHEKEVYKGLDERAYETCMAAAREERLKTIEHAEKLKQFLPPGKNLKFIFPDSTEEDIANHNIDDDARVRCAASFDMGWFTRGTGRTYDSLSGTAALIGYFTGKVIAYIVLNRKCAMCDKGHPKEDHICRLNFVGSAKAMEPAAAVSLTKDNEILIKNNLELGIMIADNDSSSICAVRGACEHEIIKQSDKNHTAKGVVNALFDLKKKKNYKQLTHAAIDNLKKDFNYAVSQNKGNSEQMAKAIENIPYHCFNDHKNCGSWCGYKSNPDTYKHSVIGDGFTDPNMWQDLHNIFASIAQKSHQFTAGASSNPNESLNAMIVSKAPKSRLYGKSFAAEARVASAINKKNSGEMYIADLAKKLSLSPGKHCQNVDRRHLSRKQRVTTRAAKLRRILLKKKKTSLKHKNELIEGVTYETDMGLLTSVPESIPIILVDKNLEAIIIYFDLETGGFLKTDNILQIAGKHGDYTFSVYVTPTKTIPEKASEVHGLRIEHGKMTFHGQEVQSCSLLEALVGFYEFLCLFRRKCILAAHNCNFDYLRIMRAIDKTCLNEHFSSVVEGFADTLPIIKKKTGKRSAGDNKLENLAKEFGINCDGAHDAIQDVIMLEKVIIKLHIPTSTLRDALLTWIDAEIKIKFSEELPGALKKLDPLKSCLSSNIRKKIVAAGISLDMIYDAYKLRAMTGLVELFGKNEVGEIKVTRDKRTLGKLFDYLKTNDLLKPNQINLR